MRFSRGSCARGGQAPALRCARPSPFPVGRGPVPRRASVGERAWLACVFRAGRVLAGDRPPRYGRCGLARIPSVGQECLILPVREQVLPNYSHLARERSRGTGPRATGQDGVLVTVGRGPVPRRASVGEKPWLAFGFRVGRTLAGDRPPRYGPGRGSPLHAPVRDQVLPNDGLLPLILLIV